MQVILEELYQRFLPLEEGAVAQYIPELSKVDPNLFGIAVVTVDGECFEVGDSRHGFTLQSVSKPFVYGMALESHGRERLLKHVGVEPTGNAFNSIIELERHSHRPYNPMINSGAIAVTSLIEPGAAIEKRWNHILKGFEAYLGHPISYDQAVFESERNTGHRNRAIAYLLRNFGVIGADIEDTLELYFRQCSISVNTMDLALMAATLAGGGVQPLSQTRVLSPESTKDLLSLMFTCGMYDSAGEWAYTVGLPAKSGVSGGILTVVPGRMGIAVYSPRLDSHGHSVRGLHVMSELARREHLSLFDPKGWPRGERV